MLDFNREKDGPYSSDISSLSLANLTYDLFTVTGQGVSGSYRPFRSEVGHVFDAATSSNGAGVSAGAELGGGLLLHGGADVMVNFSDSRSGDWTSGNAAGGRLRYQRLNDHADLEPVYFREANEATVEQDSSLWVSMRRAEPMGFSFIDHHMSCDLGNALTSNWNTSYSLPTTNFRTKREPRAQVFSYLTHADAIDLALDVPPVHSTLDHVPGNHISEITVLSQEGQRYIYGVPLYNIYQDDVEFNVGVDTNMNRNVPDSAHMVAYDPTDISTGNARGKDHFYSRSRTPAYAHAFLLSSAVSTDYSDVDAVRGPSDGDLGNWTHFTYTGDQLYHWRTPICGTPYKARYSRGLDGTLLDDKASFVCGAKEVRQLRYIESRNFIAVFSTSSREDAKGVDEAGNILYGETLQRLDSISLYEKKAYWADTAHAQPIKRVHFEYDYELCPGTPNSTAGPVQGKLTLKKLWFTYGRSNMGRSTPYEFRYGTPNPHYDMNAQDRWGGLKPNMVGDNMSTLFGFGPDDDCGHLRADEFPYAEQNPAKADPMASAWCMDSVFLPTGGIISVTYEADDYASVQNKPAMRMFRIGGMGTDNTPTMGDLHAGDDEVDINQGFVYFKIPDDLSALSPGQLDSTLFKGIGDLYFRNEVATVNSGHDFVSGYAAHGAAGSGILSHGVTADRIGWIELRPVPIDGDGDDCSPYCVSPFYRSALEFIQANYGDKIFGAIPDLSDEQNPTADFFRSVASSIAGLISGIGGFFQGPNAEMASKSYCEKLVTQRSYIRLNEPDHSKKGGGHRVRSIRFADNWGSMEASEPQKAATYGQDYAYGDATTSFGVAAYEPMSGADENPWRVPRFGTRARALSPDERFYQEEPFGESFFPSPVVGYSKVIVTNYYPTEELRQQQGVGSTVHEFYTAADFPTRTAMTELKAVPKRNNTNVLALLGFRSIDRRYASQGFTIETNDMHGKPKRVTVLAKPAGDDLPPAMISKVDYIYETSGPGGTGELRNSATTIDEHGNVGQAEIGRQYEFVADMRSFTTNNSSGGAELNAESLWAMLFPLPPIPIVIPKFSSSDVTFRTGTLVKKVERFGLLREVRKTENGSTVSTQNLAYDALTGNVLLTSVQNDFGDPIYTMAFPAYWYYHGMGPAYRNIGAHAQLTATAGWAPLSNAPALFVPGDELAAYPDTTVHPFRCWVDSVDAGAVYLIDRSGGPVNGTVDVRVIRSGRRNMQAQDMMDLTLLENPLQGLQGNVYANILDAKATEFNDRWRTECACLTEGTMGTRDNPWLLDRLGVWRLQKERVWLTDRTRAVENGNTNIRRDGIYASFAPFYRTDNGSWTQHEAGWTTAREVTQYGTRGQELENKDALGIFSSASFGYRGNLPKTVAKNAAYQEVGFDGFEEPVPADCSDRHFRFNVQEADISDAEAHTGRHSVQVLSGHPVVFSTVPWDCQQDPCAELTLVTTKAPAGSPYGWVVSPAGGTPPYLITPLSFTGEDVTFTPLSNALGLSAPTEHWSGQVHVADAAGCYTTLTVVP